MAAHKLKIDPVVNRKVTNDPGNSGRIKNDKVSARGKIRLRDLVRILNQLHCH